MTTTVVLTALPAKYVRSEVDMPPTLIVKPFGRKLGIALLTAKSIAEIAESVAAFGNDVSQRLPDFSFYITIRIRTGDVPPSGFAQAAEANAFSQDAHTRVFDHCDQDCLAAFDGRIAKRAG